MSKTTPKKIVEKLKDNLINVDANKSRNLLYIKRAFGICFSALLELCEWINQFNFTVKNDEIHFLKVAKPYVPSKRLFHSKLFEVDANQLVVSINTQNNYLKKIIFEAQFFFDENPEFYPHYRSCSEHLDKAIEEFAFTLGLMVGLQSYSWQF